jgi:2-polyprenyl-3-methyl-5-hydroxy-6-metoxy-1,4-benzoquinol methylase
MKERTRANAFDREVGVLQTRLALHYGVGRSILDVGCGFGEYTPLFLRRFPVVYGLDPSEEYLKQARLSTDNITYIQGFGETFKSSRRFDTISSNDTLEHVDDPISFLSNCARHLHNGGRLIVQVPNSESVARRLGVIMGVIPGLDHISDKERDFYGHKRVYTLDTLRRDCEDAGLKVVKLGGLLYKPLPNIMLGELVSKMHREEKVKFIEALVEFGKDRPRECAQIYAVCV